MTAFDLYSNDWLNIALLHNEHMVAETLYMEQMHRWALRYGRAWGVIHLEADALQVFGSPRDYAVSLAQCQAVTSGGYLIHLESSSPPLTFQGSNETHRDSLVPLYVGVAVEKTEINTGSSQSGSLLDRPALGWKYRLATEPDSPRYDWLQIGRMQRGGQSFQRDDGYIPQCVHLHSHPALIEMARAITREAQDALTALEDATKARSDGQSVTLEWLGLIGALMNPLASAAVLLDWDAHPRAYMERLTATLRAYDSLLLLLENKIDESPRGIAIDRVRKALTNAGVITARQGTREELAVPGLNQLLPESTRPGQFWWDSFNLILQAMQALTLLLRGLGPSTGTPQSPASGGGGRIIRDPQPFTPARKV